MSADDRDAMKALAEVLRDGERSADAAHSKGYRDVDHHEEMAAAVIAAGWVPPSRLAKAWDEGARAAGMMLPSLPPKQPRNPYRDGGEW